MRGTWRPRFVGTSAAPSGEYVRRQRIALACRSLAESDMPLADVAIEAGFADQSHFTRTFKRQLGVTPAAYRRQADSKARRSKS